MVRPEGFCNTIKDTLFPGKLVEANDAYCGEPGIINTPTVFYTAKELKVKKRICSRHETVNKRFKQSSILKTIVCHDFLKHSSVFRAIAVITQLSIECGEPLFDVEYDMYDDF